MQQKCSIFSGLLLWCLFLNGIASAAPSEGTGLQARARDGSRDVSFTLATPNMSLAAGESIHAQLGPGFSAEITGVIRVVRGGKYEFRPDGDSAEVDVDGKPALRGPMALAAGDRPIRVRIDRRDSKPFRFQLQWKSEFFDWEPIPASAYAPGTGSIPRAPLEERGRYLIEELNCAGCHPDASGLIEPRTAPVLDASSKRLSRNWIFHWLDNPSHFRADARMPTLGLSVRDRADLAAFLSGASDSIAAAGATAETVKQGQEHFEQIGCAACHDPTHADLSGIGSKISAPHLSEFLFDPLRFDPGGRMPDMGLRKPEADAIAAYLVQSQKAEFEAPAPAGNSDRGRKLAETRGCAACHEVRSGGVRMISRLQAPALNKLRPQRGCLAERVPKALPNFRLRTDDRAALSAYLKSPDRSRAPLGDFHRLLTQFQCQGCHEFQQPARLVREQLPPSLTDAGNKLRESWLEQVLNQRKRVRPWMALRMPHFGSNHVGRLVSLFAAQAGAERGEGQMAPASTKDETQKGARLIGREEGGLSCVTCHDFKGQRSSGDIRGPDMIEMYARIRVDWLRRWLREPSRIQPGTAMPAFFSDVDPVQREKTIGLLIAALSAGAEMLNPPGLSDPASTFQITVRDEPVILRTFIQDSSPRSIAVGLPGGQNYVFDAQLCRLRYAWTGAFLDVRPVWSDRGGGEARILGKKYFTTSGSLVKVGSPDSEPAPRFRGYRLVQGVPEFAYEVDGVTVHEKITALPDGSGLLRSVDIEASSKPAWIVPGIPSIRVSADPPSVGDRIRLEPARAHHLKFKIEKDAARP